MLYYPEEGTATLENGKTLHAHRKYAYIYTRGTIAVHFWDQAKEQPTGLLYTLQCHGAQATGQALVAAGTHWCLGDVLTFRGHLRRILVHFAIVPFSFNLIHPYTVVLSMTPLVL